MPGSQGKRGIRGLPGLPGKSAPDRTEHVGGSQLGKGFTNRISELCCSALWRAMTVSDFYFLKYIKYMPLDLTCNVIKSGSSHRSYILLKSNILNRLFELVP